MVLKFISIGKTIKEKDFSVRSSELTPDMDLLVFTDSVFIPCLMKEKCRLKFVFCVRYLFRAMVVFSSDYEWSFFKFWCITDLVVFRIQWRSFVIWLNWDSEMMWTLTLARRFFHKFVRENIFVTLISSIFTLVGWFSGKWMVDKSVFQ